MNSRTQEKLAYYARNADNPHHPCGFRGEWAISDHSLIPEVVREFLMFSFETAHLKRIELSKINDLLNREWDTSLESPMSHIQQCVEAMRHRDIKFERSAPVKYDKDDHDLPVFSWDIYNTDQPEGNTAQ